MLSRLFNVRFTCDHWEKDDVSTCVISRRHSDNGVQFIEMNEDIFSLQSHVKMSTNFGLKSICAACHNQMDDI